MTKVAQLMARLIGGSYVLLAALAYALPNPLIGSEGLIRTGAPHDILHSVLGLILLGCSLSGETISSMGPYFVAFLSAGLAFLGLLAFNGAGVGRIADTVLVNGAGNWLHAVMALVCAISGMKNTASKQVIYD